MKDYFDNMREMAEKIVNFNMTLPHPQLKENFESQKAAASKILTILTIVNRVKELQNTGWQIVAESSNLLPGEFDSITAPSDRDQAMDGFKSVGELNLLIRRAQSEVAIEFQKIMALQQSLEAIMSTSQQAAPVVTGVTTFTAPSANNSLNGSSSTNKPNTGK
jgi:hypothetical protein